MNTERKMYLKAMKNTEAPSLPVIMSRRVPVLQDSYM